MTFRGINETIYQQMQEVDDYQIQQLFKPSNMSKYIGGALIEQVLYKCKSKGTSSQVSYSSMDTRYWKIWENTSLETKLES